MQKVITNEALALRKLREIRGLDRRKAAILLEISPKTVESFENGRSPLSKQRVSKYLSLYGFSEKDFELCLAGASDKVKENIGQKRIRIIEHNELRRSYKKIITKEVIVIQAMRRIRGVSQYQASRLCGYCTSAIGHVEAGRIELSEKRLKHIVESYGFSIEDFHKHMATPELITDVQEKCISILRKLSMENLRIVLPILENFVK